VTLRPKLMFGVLGPLAVVLALLAYAQYHMQRDAVLAAATRTSGDLSNVIENSLQHAMLTENHSELQVTIDSISRNSQVVDLLLLNPNSEVRAASPSAEPLIGHRLDVRDPGCALCHGTTIPSPNRSVVTLLLPAAGPVLRSVTPVTNRPACYGCHDSSRANNGVFIVDLALGPVNRDLAADLRRTLALLAGALVLGAGLMVFTMEKSVVRPVERLAQVVRAFDQGDLGRRMPISGRDEISDLARAFDHLADGVEGKLHLEQQLRQRSAELQRLYGALQEKEAARAQLLKQVIDAQEAERKRVARELHDELAQSLAGLLMSLDAAEAVMGLELPDVSGHLARTRTISAQALDLTRQLILELRPTMLDDLGLVAAIRWYADRRLPAGGVTTAFQSDGLPRRLEPALETALFRIAQEAINNAARHAQASQVRVRLLWEADWVMLEVEDDGQGFDPATPHRRHDEGGGMGLVGIQERAEMLCGTVSITSRPGEGSRIRVVLPVGGGPVSDADSSIDR
jgi:signal transduction histidine kinase